MSTDWRVVHQAASWCLGYPDEALRERVPMLRAALAERKPPERRSAERKASEPRSAERKLAEPRSAERKPPEPVERKAPEPVERIVSFLDYLDATGLPELQQSYVELFDLNREHTLYLSYWTAGDTRRRGEVLGRFKRHYRDSGFLVDLAGELPDYLPVVLEFAAVADPEAGCALLQEFRAGIELARIALVDRGTPYADLLTAVCATLPGASPADRAAAMKMAATGPPSETVGLEPYDPRLLPLADGRGAGVDAGTVMR